MNASLRFLAVLCVSASPVLAGPLQQAAINQIVKDVKVVDPAKGARPAALKETIKDDLAVKTGVESRAELLFQDNTLTRLGAETFFSFKAGTRDLSLDRGTMLLQVPKGLGGARIRTASVTASITGTTIMMEYLPSKHLKVLVLEGSLRLSPTGRFGEAMLLTAGKMVIMKPDAKRIPEPVEVDLRKVMKTSSLIDSKAFKGSSKVAVTPLPSLDLIDKEIARQDSQLKGRGLVATNLVISGSGTSVTMASDEMLTKLDAGKIPLIMEVSEKLAQNPAVTPKADPTTAASTISGTIATDPALLAKTTSDISKKIKGSTVAPGATTPAAVPSLYLSDGTVIAPSQTLVMNGAAGTLLKKPSRGASLEIRGPSIEITPTGIAGINVDGGAVGTSLLQAGGNGGSVLLDTKSSLIGTINIESPISATTGANSLLAITGGEGGKVNAISNSTITVNAPITVSGATSPAASAKGGEISLTSNRTSGNAIVVNNSGQLLSLLAASPTGSGGKIKFTSAGGDIIVNGGRVEATRGSVDIRNKGVTGKIELQNATVSADVVKIGALGSDGQLRIGGGTINADTALKLYAGGSNGEVCFTDDVTLGGASTKIIAGKTVTIDDKKTVTIGGGKAASVFTDNANYTGSGGNGSKTGKFGGAGATTSAFGNRPAF